ncbi:hypothetical protein RDI58_025112 [Solanum bulbocastanum]|uniref:Uncharacterized protein n=1 Tax=Solanum bulbocastanum TaxID=147425 RepID=A0AAN8SZH3_SOLBU
MPYNIGGVGSLQYNIQNTLLAWYHKFFDAQAHSDLTATSVDKCVIAEVVQQEIGYALNEDDLNTLENSEVSHSDIRTSCGQFKGTS